MNLTFRNMTLEVNIFHVGRKLQVEEISDCDCPTLVDTLEKDEEFEPLNEQSLDSFSFDDFYDDFLYHDVCNSLASCDKVQVESVSSWLPHDIISMSFSGRFEGRRAVRFGTFDKEATQSKEACQEKEGANFQSRGAGLFELSPTLELVQKA